MAAIQTPVIRRSTDHSPPPDDDVDYLTSSAHDHHHHSWVVFDSSPPSTHSPTAPPLADGWTTVASLPRHDGTGRFCAPPPPPLPATTTLLASHLDASLYVVPPPRTTSAYSEDGSIGGLSLPSSLSAPSARTPPLMVESLDLDHHSDPSLWASAVDASVLSTSCHSLTATALRQHETNEAILTSDDSDESDLDRLDSDRDERELARTPHAHSAGLGLQSRRQQSRQLRRTRRTLRQAVRQPQLDDATTTSTSTRSDNSRVKRRHRKSGLGRSQDGSAKRSHHSSESKPQVATVQENPTLSTPTQPNRQRRVDLIARVATKLLDIDEETIRMVVDSTPLRRVTPSTSNHVMGRHAQLSIGDSPMDLSGAYCPYSASEDDESDGGDETEVERSLRRCCPPLSKVAVTVDDSEPSSNRAVAIRNPTRSLSLSSIPSYVYQTWISTLVTDQQQHLETCVVPDKPNLTDVRRSNSVFDSTSTGEMLSQGDETNEVGYWKRVLMLAWTRW